MLGLEAVTDNSAYIHETALVKVNGQWLYVDGVVDTGNNPHELSMRYFQLILIQNIRDMSGN